MKKYFIDGKQVTEEQALEQEKINNKAILSDNLEDWMQCKFIIVIGK